MSKFHLAKMISKRNELGEVVKVASQTKLSCGKSTISKAAGTSSNYMATGMSMDKFGEYLAKFPNSACQICESEYKKISS